MILKGLKLKNIRSYVNEEIVFPTGSVMLAGDIGAGKSTILHAIEFALFGTRRDLSGDMMLRKGEQKGEVELAFEKEGQKVSIKRGLKRTKDSVLQDTGWLMVDGVKQELTSMELKSKILDMLGYPKELLTKSKALVYRYTVYTPQEEMKSILFDNPDSRIDTLRKVFGIDKYKKITENVQLYTKKLRDDRRMYEVQIIDLPDKEKELLGKKEEIFRAKKRKEEVEKELFEVKDKKGLKQEAMKRVEGRLIELQELKKQSEVLDAELKEVIRQRGKNLDDKALHEEQLQKLRAKKEEMALEEKEHPEIPAVEQIIKDKELKLSKMTTKKTELIERQNNLIKRGEEVKTELEGKKRSLTLDKKDELAKLSEELKEKDTIREVVEESESSIKELDMRITEIKTAHRGSTELQEKIKGLDQCPTCKQKVGEEHKKKITEAEEEKIKRLEEEMKGLVSKKKEAMEKLENYREKQVKMVELEKKIAGMKVEVAGVENIREEADRLAKMHEQLEKDKLEVFRSLQEVDDAVIEGLREEIEDKKRLVREINAYELKLKEHIHVKQMIAQKEVIIKSLSEENEQLKQRVKEINVKKIQVNTDMERYVKIQEEADLLKKEFDDILALERGVEVKLGEVKVKIEEVGRVVEMLEKDVFSKREYVKKIQKIKDVLEWIDKMFVNLMGTMERHIMIKIHQEFNEMFVEWFNLLIEDEGLSVRLDDSFCPIVEQNGHESMVDYLSGGEKTSVALAYRLALNKVVNNIVQEVKTKDLIILDEPTDGFSTEQLDKVREVLDQLDMKQIILVSHENKVESFVDNVIRVHKREHESRVQV